VAIEQDSVGQRAGDDGEIGTPARAIEEGVDQRMRDPECRHAERAARRMRLALRPVEAFRFAKIGIDVAR